jgi:hypothetical protein
MGLGETIFQMLTGETTFENPEDIALESANFRQIGF